MSTKINDRKYEKSKHKKERMEKEYNQKQERLDAIYKKEKQKSDFKTLLSRLKFETYTKRLVGIIVFIALIDLQFSYVLAFLGKDQIAETLSTQICITLLGTVMVYMIRAYFDTKAEKRDEMAKSGIIMDKDSKIIPNEIIKNKVEEMIINTGLYEHINTESSSETENPDDDTCG